MDINIKTQDRLNALGVAFKDGGSGVFINFEPKGIARFFNFLKNNNFPGKDLSSEMLNEFSKIEGDFDDFRDVRVKMLPLFVQNGHSYPYVIFYFDKTPPSIIHSFLLGSGELVGSINFKHTKNSAFLLQEYQSVNLKLNEDEVGKIKSDEGLIISCQ